MARRALCGLHRKRQVWSRRAQRAVQTVQTPGDGEQIYIQWALMCLWGWAESRPIGQLANDYGHK